MGNMHRTVRAGMRRSTVDEVAWRLADADARREVEAEYRPRLDALGAAGDIAGVLALSEEYRAAIATRVNVILAQGATLAAANGLLAQGGR